MCRKHYGKRYDRSWQQRQKMRAVIKWLLSSISKIVFRKEVETMAVIYATLIVKGKKSIDQVPEKIREQVKEILVDLEVPELAE